MTALDRSIWERRLLTVFESAGVRGLTAQEAAYAWDATLAAVSPAIQHLVGLGRLKDSGGFRETGVVWCIVPDEEALKLETIERTREGIARVDRNAPEDWKKAADSVIRRLAETRETFTADDVWWGLEAAGVGAPREPRALGARLQVAARAGLIVNQSPPVKSQRPETHGSWIAAWTSHVRREVAS